MIWVIAERLLNLWGSKGNERVLPKAHPLRLTFAKDVNPTGLMLLFDSLRFYKCYIAITQHFI